MSVSYIGVGTPASAAHNVAFSPGMPTGYAIGDLLICISYIRATTATQTSTWSTAFTNDVGSHFVLVSYKYATSTSETAPIITPTAGTAGQTQFAYVTAWHGTHPTTPFPTPGTFFSGAAGVDIGPITAATASLAGAGGAAFVYGFFQHTTADTEPIATLTGDGLTWGESFEGGATVPDVTYIGTGTYTFASSQTATTSPPLPAGTQAGDLLLVLAYFRAAPTATLTSSWTDYATNNGSTGAFHVGYKLAVGGDAAPTVTPGGGASNHRHVSVVIAFRNVNQTTPLGTHGTVAQYATSTSIGPVAAATVATTKGAVLVVAGRNHPDTFAIEDINVLSGDGLTWVEAVDYCPGTGTTSHIVADYAIWTGSAPTLTAKTFSIAGTPQSAVSAGVMCLINPIVAGVTAVAGYATWTTTVPTLTSKTFDLTYTGANENPCGQQLLIAPASTAAAVTYVGAGAIINALPDDPITPALPSGIIAGDCLLCFHAHRSAGVTNTISSGWSTHAYNNDYGIEHIVFYKIATGGDANPTVTPDGVAVGGQQHMACCVAFRGVDQNNPFGADGVQYFASPATTIGPILPVTTTTNTGAVLVFGCRAESAAGGTATVLSGDSLTWVEAFDGEYTGTNPIGPFVMDYAIWSGSPPAITAKTFTVTGGTNSYSVGRMYQLNGSASASQNITVVNVGTDASGNETTALVPTLPASIQNGDFLVCFGYLQNSGTLSISGTGWAQHSGFDGIRNGIHIYSQTWYRWVDGTQAAPTITPIGGLVTPQTITNSFIIAFRGVNTNQPFANPGVESFNASAINVGPVAVPATVPPSGAVVVYGVRASSWTSVAPLTGDGLTWTEIVDAYTTTVGTSSCSIGVDFAPWTTTPTLTAKTFVPTGGSAAPGMGKMFVLNATAGSGVTTNTITTAADFGVATTRTISSSLDVSIIQTGAWVGTSSAGDNTANLTPSLPIGLLNGDLLITFAFLQNNGILDIQTNNVAVGISTPTGLSATLNTTEIDLFWTASTPPTTIPVQYWTQHSLTDTTINGSRFYLRTWYCVYDGTQPAPTIAITGGSTSPQTVTISFVIAVRGVNTNSPFFNDGADSFNASAVNVGPIAPSVRLPSAGTAIVFGERSSGTWTSVVPLAGDSLTWVELFDNYVNTVAGIGISTVVNFASWFAGAPTLTAKTFVPSGGSAGSAMGKMFIVNMSPASQRTITCSFDVYVSSATSRIINLDSGLNIKRTNTCSLDVYITANTGTTKIQATNLNANILKKITSACSLDVNIGSGVTHVIAIAYLDVVVNPLPSGGVGLPTTSMQDLSRPTTENAWLVLLTLDHPDLDFPIRVTSDGVPTISNGDSYSPFPFEVILPDDVEGRPPQSQLRIDNTTQEIIAELRGLTTPPTLSVQIVRSITPDVVEYQWIGMEWTASSYDKSTITGTLTVSDLSREEFPFETFNMRWPGLWP